MTRTPIRSLLLAMVPILIAGIAFLETQRPFGLYRLATFILFFVLVADLTSLVRGRLQNVLLFATSLAFGLVAVEVAANVIRPLPILKTTAGYGAREPVIGWGPAHAGRFNAERIDPRTGRIVYNVIYTIDSDLLRQTHSCADCATIAFFGDSFTFGEGLNDPDTLPQAFANSVDGKLRVLNLGFSGYGPQQFLRELQTGRFDKVVGARPKLFLFLTAPWQARRTSCKAPWTLYGPRYGVQDGKVVYEGQCARGPVLWLREWVENMAAYRTFIAPRVESLSHADIDLYIRILVAATHLAKEKYGVPTLIPYLYVPEPYLRPTGFTNAEIVKRLEEGGAMVVDVTLAKQAAAGARLGIPGDGHPTALANRLRAAVIKAYIAQHLPSILPLPPTQAKTASPRPLPE